MTPRFQIGSWYRLDFTNDLSNIGKFVGTEDEEIMFKKKDYTLHYFLFYLGESPEDGKLV